MYHPHLKINNGAILGMSRGVGGIFYDDVCGDDQEKIFQFVQVNCM